ncbi:MAG TPA: ABC transporter ATP-binding protein [Candidatus Dormibacteraeota bacterium]|nr:ABC transporter ATP-binding protein [Candidatus Dormibacteraeota bacterium]
MTTTAVDVDHVGKSFRLPLDHATTLQYRVSHPQSSSRYRELRALQDVTFAVKRGEFLGITGPNGCGKSTLLKILAGIYPPDRGRVVIDGRVSPFLELGVGFKPELTARENIFLGGAVMGLSRGEVAARVGTVLDFAELEEFADQKLKNFSSGMAVRLAFSVAMMADADILLMDEVLAVGDARFQEKCFEVFGQYKQRDRTVVLVSHDLNSLEAFCDRVVLLQGGQVVVDGEPHSVLSQYRQIVAAMSAREPSRTRAAGLAASRRWGNREVEVTDVTLVGADGEPCHTFHTGDHLAVAIGYKANETVPGFYCGVGIRLGSGQVIGRPLTSPSLTGLTETKAGDRGTITYTIPTLSLLQGSYILSAYFYDAHAQEAYDHVEDALEFRVADDRGRAGLVEMGGDWDRGGHRGAVAGGWSSAAGQPPVRERVQGRQLASERQTATGVASEGASSGN